MSYTYHDLVEFLGDKTKRFIKRSTLQTWAERRHFDGAISIFMHETEIMRFHPNGDIMVTSGGWKTKTTKRRLNEYLPNGWQIHQDKSIWYLHNHAKCGGYFWNDKENAIVFRDEMVIRSDDTVEGTGQDPKSTIRLIKEINIYAHDFIEALVNWDVPRPDSGDCWMCSLVTDKGLTLGEATKNTNHIRSHMAEKYYVPSLLLRAVRMGMSEEDLRTHYSNVSKASEGFLAGRWGLSGGTVQEFWVDHARRELKARLVKYIKHLCGITT